MEDARLLTGRGRFVDDLSMEGQAYMGIVRSTFAHARINGIDLSNARSSPDFLAALTGDDLIKEGVAPVSQSPWPPQKPAGRYHLAVGKVRFAGEPVAAVLCRRKSSVEDIVERVEVDYDPLPVVTTIDESKKGETLVYEDWKTNVSQSSETQWGRADEAVASAPFVITAREGIARQESAPIEPHAALARYNANDDTYEVYATVQSVHGLRGNLASELRLPEEKFHVMVMDVGGGFGSKGAQSYPEPLLACIFSRRTGLPVKWTATRTEEFLEAAAGRDEYCDVTLACDKDGRVLALKANLECDAGVTGTQNHMAQLSLWTMLGPYRFPNVDLRVTVYATNKMPLGPVRGAGAPEGCYFIERAMSIMAQRMGIDALELRRRNLAASPEAAASRWGGGSSGGQNYGALLDALVKRAGYQELQKWKEEVNSAFERRDPPRTNLVAGIGISIRGGGGFGGGGESSSPGGGARGGSSETSGGGRWPQAGALGGSSGRTQWQSGGAPSRNERPAALDFMSETARVTLDAEGKVTVYTGSSPHGQGEETTFAQLASQELGVPLEKVSVVWGDTALIPAGIGTFGSRSAATGGSAVVDACRKLRAQLLARASEATGLDSKSLAVSGVRLVDTARPDAQLPTIGEIIQRAGTTELSASSVFRLGSMSYSTGVHLCAVTLDVELGRVKVARYVVVEDCGTIINKGIVEGQLQGGVVHAVGGALFERLLHDEQGNLLATTLMDYNIPTALDSPNVEVFHEVTPSTASLDGAKGVGESGTIAGYAAVMNAINDALSKARPGVQVNLAPATPDSIFAALSKS